VKNIQAPEIQRLIDDMVETMREYRGWASRPADSPIPANRDDRDGGDGRDSSEAPAAPTILINPRIVPSAIAWRRTGKAA